MVRSSWCDVCAMDVVFALPGEDASDVVDVLASSDNEVVVCRHEQAAAFMASIHGRMTGTPAACLVTLGPGALNLVTGVADATLDLVPLVAITGQDARSRVYRGKNSHQVVDLERAFELITKSSVMLHHGADIPDMVSEARACATRDRPGAVHISLPEDLDSEALGARARARARACARACAEPMPEPQSHAPFPNPKALSAAVNAIGGAERVMVLAGASVLRAGATEAFAAFFEKAGVPVATSFMAKGLLSFDHACHLGAFGLPVEDHAYRAIAAADLIVTVGLDPVEYPVEKLLQGGVIPTVCLSSTAMPRDLGWRLDSEVVGDLATTLEGLAKAVPSRAALWPAASEARASLLSDLNHAIGELDLTPPGDPALVAAMNATLADGDLVLSGVGTKMLSVARNPMARAPEQVAIANGLAGMGLALPGTDAAARLERYDRVLAVCGDGDVLMNVQAMETASRLDLPMTIVVWIDGGYGLIEDKQEGETGRRPDLGFADLDWSQLAGTFGWHHTHCATARDLKDCLALREAPPRRHLFTVPVRYDGSLA